jgi:hypothetical protein
MASRVVSCDYHGADTIVLADISGDGDTESLVKLRYPGHAMFAVEQNISIHWNPEFEHQFSSSTRTSINAQPTN